MQVCILSFNPALIFFLIFNSFPPFRLLIVPSFFLLFLFDTRSKSYTTENAYRSHMASKKHRDNELKAAIRLSKQVDPEPEPEVVTITETDTTMDAAESTPSDPPTSSAAPSLSAIPEASAADPTPTSGVAMTVDADADEDEITQTIDQKIASARSRLSPSHCLFCTTVSPSLPSNLTHMSTAHSFFVPEADYLVDLTGLITYLGEKIAVGNVCIYCNGKGREFRTVEAVRKHMVDKSHCKIAYEAERDKLEVSDFYDFEASYPDAEERREKRRERRERREERRREREERKVREEKEEGWEDEEEMEDGMEVDEVVDEEVEGVDEDDEDTESELSEEEGNQITYGDSHLELVLPSGARIGHRSMRRYYAQSFRPSAPGKPEDPNSGAALVRKLLADKNSALVPMKGGFGAFGSGTEVVKARNRGEAKEAGRHVKEFRDMKRRENFKTKVGFRHNSQKHFRDPLLQVCFLSWVSLSCEWSLMFYFFLFSDRYGLLRVSFPSVCTLVFAL